ncbi:ABC transporter substrate-binding protein [Alkaliphilus transvaalensis]|uniref:ABC transporter substrate-binding protein n=1 Tax=Alkaliphilus transvaalensis TaxID=114628 RepID=UPI000479B095|nr:ABC transporter substrate-binding protein [Alkaliphilus transvaalensis]
MKNKWLMLLITLLLITSVFVGCTGKQEEVKTDANGDTIAVIGDEAYPLVVVDGLGNSVTIKEKPEKVISISPSQTEVLYALGLGDKLIAVSDFCDYPVEAMDKEKVGSSWTTNTERIIELEPQIVFVYGEGQPEAIEQLTQAGVTILKFMPESIEEVFESMMVTGQVFGIEDTAKTIIDELTERRDAIVELVKGQPTRSVFYQVWDEPLSTAATGSFIDELITLAGGENIAADAEGAWPMYSVEALVEKDPEVYLAPAHMGETTNLTEAEEQMLIDSIKARPGYSQINAVVNNRIVPLEPNIVSRPGVRIIDALELIAKGIHPELF